MVVPAYPSAGGPGNASRTIGDRKLRVKPYFIYLYLQLEDVLRKLLLGIPHGLEKPSSWVSSPGESHPEALVEPYVSLSTHTAPIAEPCRAFSCQ